MNSMLWGDVVDDESWTEDEFLDEFYGNLSDVDSRADANLVRVRRYLHARDDSAFEDYRRRFAS